MMRQHSESREATGPRFEVGDWVVYCKTKFSRLPGPRARQIQPTPNGDGYVYMVDKYWVVDEIKPDGDLILRTRRGKLHIISPDNICLRSANIWERLFYRDRFVQRDETTMEEHSDSTIAAM